MSLGSDPRPVVPRPAGARAPGRGAGALTAFVVLAYGLSWAWVVPLAIRHQVVEPGRGWPTHIPALLAPAVAAVLVLATTTGRHGVGDLLRRVVRWRVGWQWWLVAVSPVAFLGVALLAAWTSGASLPRPSDFGLFSGVPAAGVLAVGVVVVVGALGEETGWRGYALPQLQRRFSPLVATLVLAAMWAGWHLPLFFVITTYRGFGAVEGVGFLLGLTCGAIVLTWLYNRTGSVLLVAVWHGVYNIVGGTQAATGMVAAVVSTLVMVQAAVLVGFDVRARRRGRPSPLAPAPTC